MKRCLSFLAILTFLASAAVVSAAPRAVLWDRWADFDDSSTLTVDHTVWDRFLAANVFAGDDGINRVGYGKVSALDRAALERYLVRLSGTPVGQLNRSEQLAFWINLYNALTVQVVLTHYPVDSIRAIRSGIFNPGPWGRNLISVDGTDITLDDIEHRILRPIWRDPRLHYALNCASLGCPDLQRQAFTGPNADALMTKAAADFINHPRGVEIDGETAIVSSIYDWFAVDFGGSAESLVAHLTQYADTDLATALHRVTEFRYGYDWDLNDATD